MKENNVSFEIVKTIGVITENSSGWTKELNIVRWNGGPAKYDIRDWDETHERMGRGITLMDKEMKKLVDLYQEDQEAADAKTR